MCFMNEARVVCPFKHGQRKAFALCVVRRMTDESESARSSTRGCLSLACGTLPEQCMYCYQQKVRCRHARLLRFWRVLLFQTSRESVQCNVLRTG